MSHHDSHVFPFFARDASSSGRTFMMILLATPAVQARCAAGAPAAL
jgi:hypothetical protein